MDLYLWSSDKIAAIPDVHKFQMSCRVRQCSIENKAKCKDKVAFPDPILSNHHHIGIESHIEGSEVPKVDYLHAAQMHTALFVWESEIKLCYRSSENAWEIQGWLS